MSQLSPRGNLAVSFGEVCDRGKVREENQDSVLNASIPLGDLFIVADGIGGYQGGAVASRMVVKEFQGQLATRPPGYPPEDALAEACAYANAAIFNEANSGDPSLQRMGSTVVLALIQAGTSSGGSSGEVASFGPIAWIGHVGDSRAYLIRGGQMIRQTNDHSAVQALLDRNLITEEEARNHPDASVLTRSLGHRPQVEIEIDRVALQEGDALLLCSDGLWGYVADADIAAVATDPGLSAKTVADTLLQLALAAGGQDNIGIEFVRIGNAIGNPIGNAVGNAAASTPAVAPIANGSSRVPLPAAGLVPSGPTGPTSVGSLAADREHSRRKRNLELLAVGLLLLGGCGYLGIAAYSHFWPFAQKIPRTNIDQKSDGSDGGKSTGGQGDVSTPKGPHRESAHPGKDAQSNRAPIPPEVSPKKPKLIGIVGEFQLGPFTPPEDGEYEWDHAIIRQENGAECVKLATDKPQVYANKPDLDRHVVIQTIVRRYPRVKGRIDSPDVERHEMNDAVRAACGTAYDAIVILPAKKQPGPTGPAAPADAPTGPGATDSQEHSMPVQQRPKPPKPQ
jgi:serine/threonine protein phosphatase PrpC